eukprot:CAMPEP_0119402896 /NCGR_PEP_ID=MMETSP1334-20130426/143112_1 /TAXON_ID=127549 /ORGANISM="Calcidiscus leptoporus, Strain RCC1130" /LENGTH=351 /DNA_ID=CAMNT_0007426835 /DNA_START=406 /DNA_END=1459 /DNA_ORIENTATION=+
MTLAKVDDAAPANAIPGEGHRDTCERRLRKRKEREQSRFVRRVGLHGEEVDVARVGVVVVQSDKLKPRPRQQIRRRGHLHRSGTVLRAFAKVGARVQQVRAVMVHQAESPVIFACAAMVGAEAVGLCNRDGCPVRPAATRAATATSAFVGRRRRAGDECPTCRPNRARTRWHLTPPMHMPPSTEHHDPAVAKREHRHVVMRDAPMYPRVSNVSKHGRPEVELRGGSQGELATEQEHGRWFELKKGKEPRVAQKGRRREGVEQQLVAEAPRSNSWAAQELLRLVGCAPLMRPGGSGGTKKPRVTSNAQARAAQVLLEPESAASTSGGALTQPPGRIFGGRSHCRKAGNGAIR